MVKKNNFLYLLTCIHKANIIQSCRRFYQPCVNSSVGQLSGGS